MRRLTRNMANNLHKKVARVLVHRLVTDPSGRRRISWFEITDRDWETLRDYLEDVVPDDPYRDCDTLNKIFEIWETAMRGADDAKKLELDQAALEPIPGLPNNLDGMRAWYNSVREGTDPE